MSLARLLVGIFSIGAALLAQSEIFGQDYPNKPIRILTANPGGSSDVAARQIAQGISGPLGQPIVVENRANILTAELMMKAAPDGYTLSLNADNLWITPLMQKVSYDVGRDFSPISLLLRDVNVLVVHPSLPAKSVRELIALAKARPGELNYAATTPAGSATLSGILFNSLAGINIVLISYKGSSPGVTGVLSGEAQVTIADPGLVMPHVKAGRLRALGVTSATPSALAPGLPAVAESGLPGYEWTGTTGIFAPAKTPATIITRLNQEIVRFLKRTDVQERFLKEGQEIVGNSPDEFAAFIKSDIAKRTKLVNDANIKIE